jgi:LysM repeat protein
LKYYHSKAGEDTIRKANNLKGNEIYLGQVLKIPLSK